MGESRSHKKTSSRIARRVGGKYNSGKGVDIKTDKITIEVETPDTVHMAPNQLRGHRGPAYIAGTNKKATDKAIEVTEGTTLGVMNEKGRVVKRSTRKR